MSKVTVTNANHSQLSQLDSVSIPLPMFKLEGWSYWLAAQIVEQWRCLAINSCSVKTVVANLGLSVESQEPLLTALDTTSDDSSLSAELTLRINLLTLPQKLQQLQPEVRGKIVDQETANLAHWFTLLPTFSSQLPQTKPIQGCLAQLQSNASTVRLKVVHQLQECFAEIGEVGTKELLNWLGVLTQELEAIYTSYEADRHKHLQLENSAWRAFYTLRAKMEQGYLDKEAIVRALDKAYNFKLKAEMCLQATQTVKELLDLTCWYSTRVSSIDVALANVRCWLSQHDQGEPLFAPLLLKYLEEQTCTAQLCKEIESRLISSLEKSGVLPQSAAIGEEILEHVRPICRDVYIDCYRSLL